MCAELGVFDVAAVSSYISAVMQRTERATKPNGFLGDLDASDDLFLSLIVEAGK